MAINLLNIPVCIIVNSLTLTNIRALFGCGFCIIYVEQLPLFPVPLDFIGGVFDYYAGFHHYERPSRAISN